MNRKAANSIRDCIVIACCDAICIGLGYLVCMADIGTGKIVKNGERVRRVFKNGKWFEIVMKK